jgi:hypothetical protein
MVIARYVVVCQQDDEDAALLTPDGGLDGCHVVNGR